MGCFRGSFKGWFEDSFQGSLLPRVQAGFEGQLSSQE